MSNTASTKSTSTKSTTAASADATLASSFATTLFDAQAQVLDLAKQGSHSAAEALESWTEFVTGQASSVLPEGILPKSQTDLLSALPTPTKAVETSFTLAEDLLAHQRELTGRVLDQLAEAFPARSQKS